MNEVREARGPSHCRGNRVAVAETGCDESGSIFRQRQRFWRRRSSLP